MRVAERAHNSSDSEWPSAPGVHAPRSHGAWSKAACPVWLSSEPEFATYFRARNPLGELARRARRISGGASDVLLFLPHFPLAASLNTIACQATPNAMPSLKIMTIACVVALGEGPLPYFSAVAPTHRAFHQRLRSAPATLTRDSSSVLLRLCREQLSRS